MRFAERILTSMLLLCCIYPTNSLSEQFLACKVNTVTLSDFERSLRLNLTALYPGGQVEPTLSVQDLAEANAYALIRQNKIVVSSSLFSLIRNSAEEMFMLAHEVGHLTAASKSQREALLAPWSTTEEEWADSYAITRLKESGLDETAGATLLSRLAVGTKPILFGQMQEHRIQALKQLSLPPSALGSS